MSNYKKTNPKEAVDLVDKGKRSPSLEDIEEADTTLWIERQLNRMRRFLSEHGVDDDMLRAVDYLLEENDRWLDLPIAEDLRAGRTT
jgi:hypothetical protein